MPEGLSATEVGKEIAEHRERAGHDRTIAIVEAVILSVVAVLAAYSGFAAAKWGTRSSVLLASASATRSKANRAALEALHPAGCRYCDSSGLRRFRPLWSARPVPMHSRHTIHLPSGSPSSHVQPAPAQTGHRSFSAISRSL